MRIGAVGVGAVALVAARVEIADAGGCSGGGGGAGVAGSTAAICQDATDIHGYRHCTKFGAWGNNLRIPMIIAEVGVTVRRFVNPLGESTGTIMHGDEAFSYRVVGPSAQPTPKPPLDTAVVAQFRLGVGNRFGMYAAVDTEVGGVAGASEQAEMTSSGVRGTPDLERQGVTFVGFTGIAGMRNRAGRVDMAAELAAGGYAVSYNYRSTYGACEQTSQVTAGRGLVEVRVRAGYWLSPFAMLGVAAGKSLIDDGWMGGLYLSAQSRSFGGR